MILNNEQKELISKELKNLDDLNSIKFATVFTKTSGNYKLAFAMFSLVSVFIISFLLILFAYKSALELIQIQILIFVGMYLFLQKFKKFFINFLPKSCTYQLASRNAHNQFYNLKQDKTKQTIMFFVSFDEKYVEIIVDDEISKIIPNSHWQSIIDEFIVSIKDDQLINGYVKAIIACSSILIEKFPNNKVEPK